VTQTRAVAIAAIFLGIGMAGEPFNPLRALIAGAIVLAVAFMAGRRLNPLGTLLFAFICVLFVCFLQHGEVYPGTAVVALGLGVLGASSFGRHTAPPVIAGLCAIVGVALFFLL
jgi:4-amino-4-deoxy-L-arabinose transferase-like glycosyltransferase